MRSEVVPREVGLALRKMSLKVAASSPKPTNNSGPSVPEQIHLRPLSGSSTYPTANVPALPHQGSSRRTTGPNLRNRRAYAAQTQEVDLDSRAVYFMVDNSSLFPWKAGLQRSLIPSTNLCDEVFYGKMRREYWKHRGWWRQWFSLYTFVGCDFYQVSICLTPLNTKQREETFLMCTHSSNVTERVDFGKTSQGCLTRPTTSTNTTMKTLHHK